VTPCDFATLIPSLLDSLTRLQWSGSENPSLMYLCFPSGNHVDAGLSVRSYYSDYGCPLQDIKCTIFTDHNLNFDNIYCIGKTFGICDNKWCNSFWLRLYQCHMFWLDILPIAEEIELLTNWYSVNVDYIVAMHTSWTQLLGVLQTTFLQPMYLISETMQANVAPIW